MVTQVLYTDATKAALKICYEAHSGQVDKSELPYVFHPFHLAEQMETESEICVALLHDVLEDTDLSPSDLIAAGIPQDYVDTLLLLTHAPDIPYLDYVENLKSNPVARKVKIADLKHNSDLTRLNGEPTEKDLQRVDKYRKALKILEDKSR